MFEVAIFHNFDCLILIYQFEIRYDMIDKSRTYT